MGKNSFASRLIRFCENIESSGDELNLMDPMSSSEPVMDDIDSNPIDLSDEEPLGDSEVLDVDVNSDPGVNPTVSISTPGGTSVTISESNKQRMRKSLAENFFKTPADLKNHMNGDDPLEVFKKRHDAKWLAESMEEENPAELERSDGRHVAGSVVDDQGNEFGVSGTLAFSGSELEIEDIDLEAVDAQLPKAEEEEEQKEEETDGLKKKSGDEISFTERYYQGKIQKNESKSLISKDPIDDMLRARQSSQEVKFTAGDKPNHNPVKLVRDNSLEDNKKVTQPEDDIFVKKTEIEDKKYQTKPEDRDC